LNTLIKNLYGKIHPLILNKIQNKGVSVSLVLYNGFDTEFEIEDESKFKNKLLSRQLAINSRMIIKVPLYEKFCLGYIHPLTSEISTKNDSITGGLLNIIEDIRLCIQEVRELKYKNYDAFLLSLKNTLDCTEVFKQLRSNGYLTYIFNFTDVKTSISYPEEYSFIDLIKDSKSLGESFIQK
jgi:sRNA-binding regulator protein Hfq